MNLCYWDFLSILNSAKIRNDKISGKPTITEGVPRSNKDMIQRLKELK